MSLRGRLLLAHPNLLDPNFARTVVLVVEHTEEGAMGLVLNRPTEIPVADAAPGLSVLGGPRDVLHHGGPVATDGLLVLAAFDDPSRAARIVDRDIGLVSADDEFEQVAEVTRESRVFAGHAGWGPGQLDAELEEEGWIVEPPEAGELLSPDPAGLWPAVLERKGGQFALLARMPLDPSVN